MGKPCLLLKLRQRTKSPVLKKKTVTYTLYETTVVNVGLNQ